ncbi:MAG: hypothetical protein GOU98_02075 [Candidatus Altiarchaeota archaeon]|nr:hypothetical protein [Candidatus Altiarchaeota archaeon]
MKGSMLGPVLVVLFVAITAVSMYGQFKFSILPKIDSWRLTRIAMMQAHLMASEFRQTDIGLVKNLELSPIKSKGYVVFYEIIEPEEPFSLPRDGYGYMDHDPTDSFLDQVGTGIGNFWGDVVYTFSQDVESDEGPEPRGYAFYSLPVVYGEDNKFGFLYVIVTRDVDEEGWVRDSYDEGVKVLDEMVSG